MRAWRALAVALCLACGLGWAATVTPLLTTPANPAYLREVVARLGEAKAQVDVLLSDCCYYGEGDPESLPVMTLAACADRGITVRLILDQFEDRPMSPTQQAAIQHLEAHGARVKLDDPQVTLHAKLIIVDRRFVIIGSSHWTYNALLGSVQVDLCCESVELAEQFTSFFELLWEGVDVAEVILPKPPWPEPLILPLPQPPGTALHAEVIPELIGRAEYSLDLLLYRLAYYPQYWDSPSNLLVDALIEAAARGVHVRVLLEGGEEFMDEAMIRGNRETAAFLLLHGVEVRLDPLGQTTHAKCLIVDEEDILVSSANWSYYSLEHNVEAGVAILATPELASLLRQFFEGLWARARALSWEPYPLSAIARFSP